MAEFPSAGYGKSSNGKIFKFIPIAGKKPTHYSFVKLIHKSLKAILTPSYLLASFVLGKDYSKFIFQNWRRSPVSLEAVWKWE